MDSNLSAQEIYEIISSGKKVVIPADDGDKVIAHLNTIKSRHRKICIDLQLPFENKIIKAKAHPKGWMLYLDIPEPPKKYASFIIEDDSTFPDL